MSVKRLVTQIVIVVGIITTSSTAQVLYVDDDAPPGGDGTSWDTAYRFLQDALTDASGGGISEIRVGQGTYKPDRDELNPDGTGDREFTFQLINGVALNGGYAGVGAKDPDDRDTRLYETILSGDLLGNDGPGEFEDNDENSYHVTTGSGTDGTAGLDGFTITAGNANGSDPDGLGAGMLNLTGSPTVTGCLFIANSAVRGGGIANRMQSSPTISDCTFDSNFAQQGGGMRNDINSSPTVSDCTFDTNVAQERGGGMHNVDSSPTVTNCAFTANVTPKNGGGGMVNARGNPTVKACTFTGNSAFFGGGMENFDNSSPTIVDCQFIDNMATGSDGGAGVCSFQNCTPTVTNCTFIGNVSPSGNGGGVGAYLGSVTTITNCTFSANTVLNVGGGIFTSDAFGGHSETVVVNTIAWGNSPDQIGDEAGATTIVDYCDVQGGWPGIGNLDTNPLFVDPDGPDDIPGNDDDDLRLSSGSPSIDSGDTEAVPAEITTDLDGNPRFVDDPDTVNTGFGDPPIVDMGAYEFCRADTNGDGVVDVVDLVAVILAWGADDLAADTNADGIVDVQDLVSVILNWGPCE